MNNICDIGSLHWDDERGYGFDSTPPMSYSGNGYFSKYQDLDRTEMGVSLTQARRELVAAHYLGYDIIDIGIGGGRFCIEHGAYGYDVSNEALDWLKINGMYRDPYLHYSDALTFWDSLEHIPDPAKIVRTARRWVFVSMPIYMSKEHCLTSKHYKPGEHLHYWTDAGLVRWFAEQGFVCVTCNDIETQIGRDGILSYAFKRI